MGDKSFTNAVTWSYIGTWGDKGFTALFTFFLAALLGPKDFGVVSIAVVYVLFLQMILDQGLATALIQRPQLEPEHADTTFCVNLGLSAALVGVSIFLSRWWAAVNHAPQAAAIIAALSLCIPIEALSIVQKSLLARRMDFKSLTVRSGISVCTGGVTGISLAYAGFGMWALVGQQIIRDVTSLFLLWRLSSWRPRLRFSRRHFHDLMGFSFSTFIAQLGIFADTYGSSVVLGIFFGPVAVGLYRLADRVMNTILAIATSSVQSVSLPEFSRFQNQPNRLRASVLSCVRLSSTVTLPALAGVAAVSRPLMSVIGEKWIPADGVLRILCALGACLVFVYFTGPLMQALARVKLSAMFEWCRTLVGLGLLLIAGSVSRNDTVEAQITSIALARLVLGALIAMPVFVYVLMRLAKVSLLDLIESAMPSLLASASILVSVLLVRFFVGPFEIRPIFTLVSETAIGITIGLLVLLTCDLQLRALVFSSIKSLDQV